MLKIYTSIQMLCQTSIIFLVILYKAFWFPITILRTLCITAQIKLLEFYFLWAVESLRMDEYRMARRVLMADVSGGRVRGRPRLGWIDGVKIALGNRGMTVEEWRWRALVHMQLTEFHAVIFALPCILSDVPPVLWWLSPREQWDAVTWCRWDKL